MKKKKLKIALEEATEKIKDLQDELEEVITDLWPSMDAKEIAYNAAHGTPEQQQWGHEFVAAYNQNKGKSNE